MLNQIDPETFDVQRFAESLVKACQEGVRWEQYKLAWILEHDMQQKKPEDVNKEAA